MNSSIETMLSRYAPKNNSERENAIKEIMQEIALAGLSRGGFFDNAAFYGGTCLRIFYGLNRFSEDLDFALLRREPEFRLDAFFPPLEREFASYGIDVHVETKHIQMGAAVQSAFLKGNTYMLFVSFFPKSSDIKNIISNQKIRIKFEIDTDNPPGGETEIRYRMLPSPYEVQIFDEATLFAGKIHAILCREYSHRVKGRDYYDYLFYIGKGTPYNLRYLENKLKNSGRIPKDSCITPDMVKQMLLERFTNVDYESAKTDVVKFINQQYDLNLWKPSLFISSLDQLNTIEYSHIERNREKKDRQETHR